MSKTPAFLLRRMLVRVGFVLLALQLASCRDDRPWLLTDVENALPDLSLEMTRARDGKVVGAKDYAGQVVILEFGYTFCPDICPTTLSTLSKVLEELKDRQKDVTVLFVTVDPNRDTAKALDDYVGSFSPRVDGLRGTPDQLADLARRYRVAYSVKPSPEPANYDVMHTGTVYFFDRKGRMRLLSADVERPEDISHDLRRLVGETD